jgi:hypothetical protein
MSGAEYSLGGGGDGGVQVFSVTVTGADSVFLNFLFFNLKYRIYVSVLDPFCENVRI